MIVLENVAQVVPGRVVDEQREDPQHRRVPEPAVDQLLAQRGQERGELPISGALAIAKNRRCDQPASTSGQKGQRCFY